MFSTLPGNLINPHAETGSFSEIRKKLQSSSVGSRNLPGQAEAQAVSTGIPVDLLRLIKPTEDVAAL